MAVGDQADVTKRLVRATPPGWFPASSPSLSALLQGAASVGSFVYGLVQFAHQQMRIPTATGGWLDLTAYDFFRYALQRAPGQSDSSFRAAILRRLKKPEATRPALVQNLTTLTGLVPQVIEPWRPLDVGTYSPTEVSAYGYGTGSYGSIHLPYQLFARITRPRGGGIPNLQSYGTESGTVGLGGYNVGYRLAWASLDMITDRVTDAQIYAEVSDTMSAGTIGWVYLGAPRIVPGPVTNLISTEVGGYMWVRVNTHPWNADVHADPSNDVGGFPLVGMSRPFYLGLTLGTVSGGASNSATFNAGGSTFAHTIPTGCVAWGSTVTLSGTDNTGVTLTGGGLSGSIPANSLAGVRSNAHSTAAGKYYFEVTPATVYKHQGVGIATGIAPLNLINGSIEFTPGWAGVEVEHGEVFANLGLGSNSFQSTTTDAYSYDSLTQATYPTIGAPSDTLIEDSFGEIFITPDALPLLREGGTPLLREDNTYILRVSDAELSTSLASLGVI